MSDTSPEDQPSDSSNNAPDENIREEEREALRALRADLDAYDNPEVFYDSTLPMVAKLRIHTRHLTAKPDVLRIEVEGENLFLAIRELVFASMREKGISETTGEPFTDEEFAEARIETLTDQTYLKIEQEMFYFFVRYFPQLMLRLYDMSVRLAVVYGSNQAMTEAERHESASQIARQLETQVRGLKNDIKRMLRTRPSGRPRKVETGPLPQIVQQVLTQAQAMMGDLRGKDVVPGLKAIADAFDLSEDALGRRLTRAGFPWTMIRTHLEELT